MKNLIQQIVLVLITFLTSQNVSAQIREVTCTPVEVRTFTNRVHVQCVETAQDATGQPTLIFFAARPSDGRLYNDLRDFGTQALDSGRLLVKYYPELTAASGTAFDDAAAHIAAGCAVGNCRLIQDLRITQAGPYVHSFTVGGIERSALIYPSVNSVVNAASPVIFFFHGHTGNIWDSAKRRRFHSLWPQATVIYAQGLYQDSNGQTTGTTGLAPGWQIRFPHKSVLLGYDNDLLYVDKLMDHIRANHRPDMTKIFAAGHSGGAFFTLSLVTLKSDLFAAYAPVAAYSRYAVNVINPTTLWDNGSVSYSPLSAPPSGHTARPIFYAFGQDDQIFDGDGPIPTPSFIGNEIGFFTSRSGLTIMDLSVLAGCDRAKTDRVDNAITYQPTGQTSSQMVHFWAYDGDHGWSEEVNNAVVDFFRNPLIHPITSSDGLEC